MRVYIPWVLVNRKGASALNMGSFIIQNKHDYHFVHHWFMWQPSVNAAIIIYGIDRSIADCALINISP